MTNWQDVMIETYGANWALIEYEKIDVFKMAEKVSELKAELKEKDVIIQELKEALETYRNNYSGPFEIG